MNMTTEYTFEPPNNGCILRIVQDGFPADESADDFFEACVIGWKNTFDGLRRYFFENPDA